MFSYAESNADGFLPHILIANGQQYMLYGNLGYCRRAYFDKPFNSGNLMTRIAAFNTAISKSRITVEWLFKKVKML